MHTRCNQLFEYMFVLSKNKPKTFNPIKIPTVTGGQKKSKDGGYRQKDGTIKLAGSETRKMTKTIGNIWRYSVGGKSINHPAPFPEQLAKDHIISWSNKGDLVFDPFAGSGTTLKMAMLNDRNYLGFEISAEYCDLINKRIGSNLSGFIHTSANADPSGHLIGIKRKPCEVSQSLLRKPSLNSDN